MTRINRTAEYLENLTKFWAESVAAKHIAVGLVWYAVWGSFISKLASEYNVKPENGAASFAILSINKRPTDNLRCYRELLSGMPVGHIGWVRAMASLVLTHSDPLNNMVKQGSSSYKIVCFAHNLLGHTDYVTVDRWIARALTANPLADAATGGTYLDMAEAIRQHALTVNLEPAYVQAATWAAIQESVGVNPLDNDLVLKAYLARPCIDVVAQASLVAQSA